MSDRALTVTSPGLYTLVVDHGRPHCRSLGVPVGGAADRTSLAVGNALVGNPSDAAALEVTLAGPTLRADCDVACVLFGAPFELAADGRALSVGKTFTLHAGEELRIGATAEGVRAYLCVRGGLQTPVVLGSRSGLAPVRAGDVLPCAPGTIRPRSLGCPVAGPVPPFIEAIDGPQADWFDRAEFFGRSFTVSAASNRMGLRLEGRPLAVPPRELVSEPVAPGAVQVTRDGQCIVLGVDGQTIGGYPKVAHVVTADLDRLAQLRPGAVVRFARVTLEQAEARHAAAAAALRPLLTRLRTADGLVP